MTEQTEHEWQPGDPLWTRAQSGGSSYRTGLFSFRDESNLPAHCCCPDAASWPIDQRGRPLPPGDELGEFITAWHRWNAEQAAEEADTP